ncbi:MAG: hypothetical protein K6E47_00775 [Lachnospiraceae bacterium]|nr:hypothetical protein [Lachnospiraceae bacterium]
MGRKRKHQNSLSRTLCTALILTVFVVTSCITVPFVSVSAAGDVAINETNFPDAGFRALVKTYDKDSNGKLSESEIAAVRSISIFLSNGSDKISDVKGINYFTKLQTINIYDPYECGHMFTLDISGCTSVENVYATNGGLNGINVTGCTSLKNLKLITCCIESLDLSTNTNLITLCCAEGLLSALDISNCKELTYIDCQDNNLGFIDFGENTKLTYLNCSHNGMFDLDLTCNTALKTLLCDYCGLEWLRIDNCKDLEILSCGYNHLDINDIQFDRYKNLRSLNIGDNSNFYSLDISQNTLLEELNCANDQIPKLDISNNPNLLYIDCSGNSIRSLDTSNQRYLLYLDCHDNWMDENLNLKNNHWLDYLDCSYNGYSSLNVQNNPKLVTLNCYGNLLASLNLNNNPLLNYLNCGNNELSTLDVSKNELLEQLFCDYNPISSLDLSKNRYLWEIDISETNLLSPEKELDITNTQLFKLFISDLYPDITVIDNSVPVQINSTNFPDENFRECVRNLDYNYDGKLSKNEIRDYGEWIFPENVSSLKGIEYLTLCKGLSFDGNVSNLDLSNNRIIRQLTIFECNLEELDLTDVPLLEKLDCADDTNLKKLDLSNCSNLIRANVEGNHIDEIDLSGNVYLRKALRSNDWTLDNIYLDNDRHDNWGFEYNYLYIDSDMCSDYNTVLLDDSDLIDITVQPRSVTVAENETATFEVTANGSGLKYLWQYYLPNATKWVDWTAKTTSKISVAYSSERNGMFLRCRITDQNGDEVVTTPVKLTYTKNNSIKITENPSNATVNANEIAYFSVKATGNGLTYLWQYKNKGESTWIDWTNKKTASISVAYLASRNGMSLRCVITDKNGNKVTSQEAVLTYKAVSGPIVTTQPKSTTVNAGELAYFSVKASGSGLTYLWQYKEKGKSTWTDWTSKKTAEISVAYLASRNGMSLRCVVTDKDGNKVTSGEAVLTYKSVSGPVISTQPKKTTVAAGELAYFSVKASGSGLTYLWQYKEKGKSTWTDWTSKKTAEISVAYLASRNGMSLRCVVTDKDGNKATSNEAVLTYGSSSGPVITTQPKNTTVAAGELAYFSVKATGSGLTYLWQYKNKGESTWTDWTSKKTAEISVAYLASRNGMSLRCVITDKDGNKVTSSEAVLTYGSSSGPVITTQPKNTTVGKNELAYFSVKAAGDGLKYLWQYKNKGESTWTDWTTKTTADINVAYAAYRNGMSLRCVVTDKNGNTVTSNAATLTYSN